MLKNCIYSLARFSVVHKISAKYELWIFFAILKLQTLAYLTGTRIYEDALIYDDINSDISSEMVLFYYRKVDWWKKFLSKAWICSENESPWLWRVNKSVMTIFRTAELLL